MMKALGEDMIQDLHAVLSIMLHFGDLPHDWKKGAGCSDLEKGRGTPGLQQ